MNAARALWLLCCFLSGATGLVYEITWTRSLTLVFGSTTFAVSTVLAAFMGGLGAGALAIGKIVDRVGRPLRVYALLELGIAGSALALPVVLPALVPLYRAAWERYHAAFVTLSLLRFGILFVLLLVPTMLMGGTLPALVKLFERRDRGLGRPAGLLYGLNTLGAVAGAAVAGFVLLPALGLRRTTMLAAAMNLAIGAVALSLSRADAAHASVRALDPCRGRRRPTVREAALIGAFALSGFVALVAEVAWTRGLTLVLGSSTYAFTIMLVTFLTGIAGGSLLMARLVAPASDLQWSLALLQAGIGLGSLLGAHFFAGLPLLYLYLFQASSGSPTLLVASLFALAGLVMLAPALLMGAVFPVVVQLLGGSGRGAGAQVGLAYAGNTVGAVLGAFLAGFVLVPTIGIAGTLTLGVGLSLALAAGVLVASGRRWRAASVVAALLLALPALAPRWDALAMASGVYKEAPLYLSLYTSPREVFTRLLPQFRLLYHRDGPTATVTVTERPSLEERRHLALSIDGKVDASTAGDMPTQVLSGHIPLLLHPHPEKVAVVGLASGVTVGAVARHPVREITAVEIEPAVVEASRLFASFNHRPLDDPRVRLVVDDARSWLLLSRDRWDVIVSEPSNPWMSGPSRLFTHEFFALGRHRLRPGGLFVQWLQLYGMTEESLKVLVRTFEQVFPRFLVFQPTAGDLVLVGTVDAGRIRVGQVRARMGESAVAADLARVGVHDVFDLLTRFRLGDAEARAYAGEGPINTDDNAIIEFSAPWQIHLDTIAQNVEALARAGGRISRHLDLDETSAAGQAEFLSELAARALVSGRARQAESLAREALGLAGSADGLWILGEALARRGRTAEALSAWEAASAPGLDRTGALLSLAAYHDERGDATAARQYLARLGARYREDPIMNFLLGANRYHLGLYRSALAYLSRVGRPAAPGGVSARWWKVHFAGSGLGVEPLTRYYLHLVYGRLGDKPAEDEAWARFLEGIEEFRREAERGLPDRAFTLERVRRLSEGGVRPEDAHLDEVLVRNVIEPMTRYYEGVTAYLTGYPETAKTELEGVLTRLGPAGARSRAHYYLGLAVWKLGRLAEARLHLEGFLEHLETRDRESLVAAEASRALSAIHTAQGQHERSAEFARQAGRILRAIEAR
ncbi:MAG: fused MFS/spermidine synthase [candidate division NC10 bacterium]|nr:fused MFS/spermidine synthase [candidate division NC10 bacterium]